MYKTFAFLGLLIFVLSSCKTEYIADQNKPDESHETYAKDLKSAGLGKTALVQEWLDKANSVVNNPSPASLPFHEIFYLDPSNAQAAGFRIMARRGELIEIAMDREPGDSSKVFIDLFKEVGITHTVYELVASANERGVIQLEARKKGFYVLRIQPELLRGGSYSLSILTKASLAFPVAGKNDEAVGSFFGVPRDGGRRKHHGVDIFASRHTPIIAPTDGIVHFAGVKGIGGRVVWLYDYERDQSLYFAHLQDILVDKHDWINKGDTIGTVGNTGNAINTPPHLHFGIYSRGPLDPLPFISTKVKSLTEIDSGTEFLNSWVRVKRPCKISTWSANSILSRKRIDKYQVLKVNGVTNDKFRVSFPDQSEGYIAMDLVELAEAPIDFHDLTTSLALLDAPVENAIAKARLEPGDRIQLLGKNTDFWYVIDSLGKHGWIESL